MIRCSLRIGALALFALLTTLGAARAGTYSVLYSFQGSQYSDGSQPQGNLLLDASGNLWGATFYGGQQFCNTSCGTIFELAPGGTETVWEVCCGPTGGLYMDANGNLWGTTQQGGNYTSRGKCPRLATGGCGEVFELEPSGNGGGTIYVFDNSPTNPNDGYAPGTGMLHVATRVLRKGQHPTPTFYGTTTLGGGGTYPACAPLHAYDVGCGAVYKVNGNGAESVVYGFQGTPDGQTPSGPLVADSGGNLYGVTQYGGASNCGTIYRIAPAGSETVLYSFTGGSDGCQPQSNLVLDSSGTLYGTAWSGGSSNGGTVFQLAANGTFTVIYAFSGGTDGGDPWNSLVRDRAGNLYGVTEYGGNTTCSSIGCGVVYEIDPRGVEIVLHAFAGGTADGRTPNSLITGTGGLLYGTTQTGGSGSGCSNSLGCGTVFSVYQFR